MKDRKAAAIKKAANEIDTNAHLFFLNAKNDSCAIQYTSDSREIVARFFSAFPLKKETTNRIVLSRLKKMACLRLGW